jgi:hypothetical protein
MVDPVLTTIAQVYSNPAMVADKLFPVVPVSKMAGKIPVFGKEAFVVRETDRAIRADSNRIPPSDITLVEFETVEKDVEVAIDYLEEEETPDFYKYEQRVAKELQDILLLGVEKEVADYVQDTANFDSGMKLEVAAGVAWDDYTNDTDPIQVIRNSMATVRGKIARHPNTMIIGDAAYQTLVQHPKVTSRVKYAGISNVTEKVLGELTGIDNIHIGTAVYSTDGSTFSDVWNDNVVLAYVDQNEAAKRSEFNPSYGYIFRRNGKPEIDTYYENGGKIKVVRNTDNYCAKVTATDAAFLISNVNHS